MRRNVLYSPRSVTLPLFIIFATCFSLVAKLLNEDCIRKNYERKPWCTRHVATGTIFWSKIDFVENRYSRTKLSRLKLVLFCIVLKTVLVPSFSFRIRTFFGKVSHSLFSRQNHNKRSVHCSIHYFQRLRFNLNVSNFQECKKRSIKMFS